MNNIEKNNLIYELDYNKFVELFNQNKLIVSINDTWAYQYVKPTSVIISAGHLLVVIVTILLFIYTSWIIALIVFIIGSALASNIIHIHLRNVFLRQLLADKNFYNRFSILNDNKPNNIVKIIYNEEMVQKEKISQ